MKKWCQCLKLPFEIPMKCCGQALKLRYILVSIWQARSCFVFVLPCSFFYLCANSLLKQIVSHTPPSVKGKIEECSNAQWVRCRTCVNMAKGRSGLCGHGRGGTKSSISGKKSGSMTWRASGHSWALLAKDTNLAAGGGYFSPFTCRYFHGILILLFEPWQSLFSYHLS